MKRIVIQSFALICVFALMFSGNIHVFASEPRSTMYIISNSCGIERTANEEFRIMYSINAGTLLDRVGVNYISIQRSTDQQSWTTEKTLYYFSYPELVREDSYTHSGSILYSGKRGYYYRAHIVFLAQKDDNAEGTTMFTKSVYIPQSGNGGRMN